MSWVSDIIHYMCEFRIWTKSDDELVDMFYHLRGVKYDWLFKSY